MLDTRQAYIEHPDQDFDDVTNRSLAIKLPFQGEVNKIALDIGGSLAKLVYIKDHHLHFVSFETGKLDSMLDYLKPLTVELAGESCKPNDKLVVNATGGGAFKYNDKIREILRVPVAKFDEIDSLIKGATFFLSQIPNEVFSWDSSLEDPMIFAKRQPNLYPYMIVNIGSGVGFIKVEGYNRFQRVGGSAIGGGTLWGLLAMLTPAETFDEMLNMATQGDNTQVDMLVGDIYGHGYPKMGLSASTTASFFAKAFGSPDLKGGRKQFDSRDICSSLLIAISYNIAQLAYLQARINNVENIYFAGSYIRGHRQTIETLSNGIRYWSKGDKCAYFFRHEGYLGALGAYLSMIEESE